MKKIKKFLKAIGPGFVTGASDDDPSGIGTYSQTGAQFGFSQLWVSPFSLPFMVVVQEICGRIGMVTGKGLSQVIKEHYSKKVLYLAVFLVFFANVVNIGADLGAMASSVKMIFGFNFTFWLFAITGLSLALQILVPYKIYSKILKYFSLTLLTYVVTAFVVDIDWQNVFLNTLLPNFSFDRGYLLNIVAIFGTTISPYLFFWQASEEVEEEVNDRRLKNMGSGVPKVGPKNIHDLRVDTFLGMFFANIGMFFIMVTTASTLGKNGVTDIQTAHQAAEALRPLAGEGAYLLFTLGILGLGLLAVPVLAGSASYALSEIFGWKEGLYLKFKQAHGFYGVIIFATILGLLVNLSGIPSFKLLYYTAVFNGICAPILLVIIMFVSSNKKIMGEFVNSKISNIMGWAITVFMGFCALALIFASLAL